MSTCLIASEGAHFCKPHSGTVLSRHLTEELDADPVQGWPQGLQAVLWPTGSAFWVGAAPPLYLSLLVDLTVPGLGSPWLSSNRFRALDLALGAPSDLGPPSSQRPGLQGRIIGQWVITTGLPWRQKMPSLFLDEYWCIIGLETGGKILEGLFSNNWFSCW
jgi:hypothetical protein